MKKSKILIYLFLFMFSVIFIGIGSFVTWNNYNLVSQWEKTTGIVVDNVIDSDNGGESITYAPILQYKCNGLEMTKQSNSYYSSKYDIWTKINIYCNPAKPDRFIIDSFMEIYWWIFFLIPGFIALIFGIWMLLYDSKKAKLIEYLKTNWTIITAEVVLLGKYTVNGKKNFYVKAVFRDGVKDYYFSSDNISKDISNNIKVWDPIEVYVYSDLNGLDYKKYWIDTKKLTN